MDTLELARAMAQEAVDTKAKDLKILDLRNLVSYTDYFILATATSDRHAKAISEKVYQKVKKDLGRLPISFEGEMGGEWILLDYGDAVLHLFLPEKRDFYGLDELWRDAPRVGITASEVFPIKKAAKKPAKPARPRGTPKSKTKRKKTSGARRRR